MKKDKSVYYIIIVVSLILLSLCLYKLTYKEELELEPKIEQKDIKEEKQKIKKKNIRDLINTYKNDDIIGIIEIPGLIESPILQANDNNYYLNRNINKELEITGSIYMDYRTKFDDRKILIYGHSGKTDDQSVKDKLPFLALNNYNDKSFYEKYKFIYLYSEDFIYKYYIISSYIETTDLDYVNINSFGDLTYLEHINKLKNKSNYNVPYELKEDSKILILQTCSMDDSVESNNKFQIVIGVLEEILDN